MRGSSAVERTDSVIAASRVQRGWALALTSIASFMVALDALVVITALPSIQRDLKAGISTLEWTVNAYSLVAAAGIITGAALGDRFGRRRVFVLGLSLFTTASAACALAPTAELLIAARAVQGLGAALVTPLTLTILAGVFPPERRGLAVGIWGGIAGLAVASGPLVGGAVTQGLDWHWIFWINVPIGLLASALALLRLPESFGPATRLDLPGVGLVSTGAFGIVWGLVRANEVGWGNPQTLAVLGLGVLLMTGFVVWEGRAPAPMLPLRLFHSRTFAAANATAFLMSAAVFAAAFLITQYLQIVLGYSPLSAGLRFLPMTATPLVVAPAAGILSDRIGSRRVLVAGMLLFGIGLGWFTLAATSGVGYGQLILPLLVAGVGVSIPFATVAAVALSAVAPVDMGKASGANGLVQRFGGVFGIALATAVFSANGHLGTAAGFNSGFRPALAITAGLAVLGILTALAVAGRPRVPAARPEPSLPVPEPSVQIA